MSDNDYGDFIVKIISTLKKNGFPEKKVSLPLEKLYETAYDKGLNLNKVLEFLKEKEQIDNQKTPDKIIFSAIQPQDSTQQPDSGQAEAPLFDSENIRQVLESMPKEGPMAKMMEKAQDMLKTMTPEQMQQMGKMFSGLSDDKKKELMKKGKDLGLF